MTIVVNTTLGGRRYRVECNVVTITGPTPRLSAEIVRVYRVEADGTQTRRTVAAVIALEGKAREEWVKQTALHAARSGLLEVTT